MLSLKSECLQRMLVPLRIADMRAAIEHYLSWYGEHRPHQGLGGATPHEVLHGDTPALQQPRLEPRARYPVGRKCASPQRPVRGKPGCQLRLLVSLHEGEKHLPIVEIREAA